MLLYDRVVLMMLLTLYYSACLSIRGDIKEKINEKIGPRLDLVGLGYFLSKLTIIKFWFEINIKQFTPINRLRHATPQHDPRAQIRLFPSFLYFSRHLILFNLIIENIRKKMWIWLGINSLCNWIINKNIEKNRMFHIQNVLFCFRSSELSFESGW